VRVLFLTQRLPYAPNRGDRIRAFHMVAALQRAWDVEVVSLVHDAEEASHADAMRARGLTVHVAPVGRLGNYARGVARLPSSRPLTLELLHSQQMPAILQQIVATRPPDVVFAYCSSMARYALEPPLQGIPFVLDMVDVDSVKWAELAAGGASWPMRMVYRREAHCLGEFEREAVGRAAATLVVNEREEAMVRRLVPDARVRAIQNGIDLAAYAPAGPPSADPVVVFCGVMNYGPNADAAQRLAARIWPLVRARRPSARLLLVGAQPTAAVQRLASLPGVEVTGSVPDIRPYLWRSAVAAVPLLVARGIQNKVLEALAAGLPAVVSPAVAAGVPDEALPGCLTASSDDEFAGRILELLALPPSRRRALAGEARLAHLGWTDRLVPLHDILEAAARRNASGGETVVCENRQDATKPAPAGVRG
jgi:sugar transferase (PEP-CTERM/EpsH1 system associated)